jgi:hypothetical protein
MKYTFLSVISLLVINMALAQNETSREVQENDAQPAFRKHELSIYGTGGLSGLNYKLSENGSKSGGAGGGAGLGYTYNINPSWGIVTGVEMSAYSKTASFSSVSGEYSEGTGTDLFRFTYSLTGYEEKQNVTVFSIPVMAQYGYPLKEGSMKLYASGGLKLSFPVSAKAAITPGTATTSGYYAYEDRSYDNLPQHGFLTGVKLPDVETDIDLGFSAALALEAGLRFTLTESIALYTGLYFDYGLNNIQKTKDQHLLDYNDYDNNQSTFKYSSVLNTALVDKVNLMSIGLKVKVSFGK